jgi:hypothetical protein
MYLIVHCGYSLLKDPDPDLMNMAVPVYMVRQGNPAYKKLWYCSKQIEKQAYYTKYTQENANRIIVSCNIFIATEWIIVLKGFYK